MDKNGQEVEVPRPVLAMERRMVNVVNVFALERFFEGAYNLDGPCLFLVDAEGWDDGECYFYEVDGLLNDIDKEDFERILADPEGDAGYGSAFVVLQKLASDKYIPTGRYAIRIMSP